MAKTYAADEVTSLKVKFNTQIADLKRKLAEAKTAARENKTAASTLNKEVTRLKKQVSKLEGGNKSPIAKTPTSSAGWR